jgi:hypothetical protein
MFNAGFFQENKLPRGILLLQGDADQNEVDDIEDYIVNLMSGPPTSQWRIPVIPSGRPDGGGGEAARKIEWVSLQGTNREMEFQAWYDLQLSGIVGLFGLSMEDIGLHSTKSQPLIGLDNTPRIETSKSLVLGDILGFLQKHFNQIIAYKNPDYEVEIIGYEKADPRLSMDIDKGEVETFKSIDEKREEKGLEPYNKPWSQMPLNAHAVQMVMNEQQGRLFEGDMGMGDEGGDFGEEELEEGDEGAAGNDFGNDELEDDLDGRKTGETVEKSLGKNVARILL